MTESTPRVRMFAGPNGSGKSALKPIIPDIWLGSYINADEIETVLRTDGSIDLSAYGLGGDDCAYIKQGFEASSRLTD